MFRFNPSRACNERPIRQFAGLLLSASCALSCTIDAEAPSEPTAGVVEADHFQFAMPGVGGLNVLWAGVANPSTGSSLIVGDVDTDGASVATGSIGTIATGKSTPAGSEVESLVGYGDFDGDGQTDLLFRTLLTGKLSMWMMQGHGRRQTLVSADNVAPTFFSGPAKGHIADIDGDGISDIVWTGVVGSPSSWQYRTLVWIMQPNTLMPRSIGTTDSDTTEVIAVGNFNGDLQFSPGGDYQGHADYLKRRTRGDGMVIFENSATGAEVSIGTVPASSGWVVKAVGDFNGDLYADALWQNTSTGQLSVWEGRSNGTMVSQGVMGTVAPSSGWTLVGTADVDNEVGHARSDLIWQHKASRQTSIWRVIDSSHASPEPGRPFLGASVVGVMNMAIPLAPSELVFSRPSGGMSTVQVRNNNEVIGPTHIHVSNAFGGGAVATFDATSTGKVAQTVPASVLAGGANACLIANVSYHHRFSALSQIVCGSWN